MDVYFIRHGQTEFNARFIHQSPDVPLNEKGRGQAHTAGEALRPLNIDYLVTSEYTRAKETASIIGSILGLEPVESELFHEVRRPAFLYGKSHFNPLTPWYVFRSVLHRNEPEWHYDHAESFYEIRERSEKAYDYLEGLSGEHKSVAVVSHTIFINLLIGHMCKERPLTVREILPPLLHITKLKNGEIVHLKNVDENDCGCGWRLA